MIHTKSNQGRKDLQEKTRAAAAPRKPKKGAVSSPLNVDIFRRVLDLKMMTPIESDLSPLLTRLRTRTMMIGEKDILFTRAKERTRRDLKPGSIRIRPGLRALLFGPRFGP